MSHYDELVREIAETTALRGILPEESEIYAATCDREKQLRAELALQPEHVECRSHWRAFGDWFRVKHKRRQAPAPQQDPLSLRQELLNSLPFVSLPTLDSA